MKSLAYKTSLALVAFNGRVEDRGDYVFVETPANPKYYWGNILVMKNAPNKGDFTRWLELFKKEFSHQPLIKHMVFGWDSTDGSSGDFSEFTENGFKLEESVVLTLRREQLRQAKRDIANLEIRPLVTNAEWKEALEVQVLCRPEIFSYESYLPYKRSQMLEYRQMSDAGRGHWFGAFLDGRLVGDCGVYVFDGVGRYQMVGTHPDFRNRGVCGNLIYQSAKYAFEKMNAQKLVMVADPEYHAAKVYQSVGFVPTEKAVGLYKYPKDEKVNT